MQVQRGGAVGVEIRAAIIADLGAVMAQDIKAAGRAAHQIEESIVAEGAAEPRLA